MRMVSRGVRRTPALITALLALSIGTLEAQHGPYDTPEGLVRHLYDLVTFPAGTLPDWDSVRATFIPEAVIVLRTSRSASTVMSVDHFVADWLRFVDEANVEESGFTEEILNLVPLEFGDIAHVLVGDRRCPRYRGIPHREVRLGGTRRALSRVGPLRGVARAVLSPSVLAHPSQARVPRVQWVRVGYAI